MIEVSARNAAFEIVESCAGWSALSAQLVLHDVGTWSMTLPITHAAVPVLAQPWSGIDIRRAGASRAILSGFVRGRRVEWAEDERGTVRASVTFSGVTDELVPAALIAYATPSTEVSTTTPTALTAAAASYTGKPAAILSALIAANAGPAAGLARRRHSWLTVEASTEALAAGTSRTLAAIRGRDLLSIADDLWWTSPDVVLTCSGVDGGLVVHIDVPPAQVDVSWPVAQAAFTQDDAVVDEVVAEVKTSAGAAQWLRRTRSGASGPLIPERLIEASGTTAEVLADLDRALADDGPQVGADITGADTPASAYGLHYGLGSVVAVDVPDVVANVLGLAVPQVSDVVGSVSITHDGGAGPLQITRSLGRRADSAGLDRQTTKLGRDLFAALGRRA